MTATAEAIEITPVHLKHASDADYAELSDFENRMRAERLPDDPPIPLSERVSRWRATPEHVVVSNWVARIGGQPGIVGSAGVGYETADENRHLVDFGVSVLPEFRRRGIGRRLLERVAEVPRAQGRRLMLTGTSASVPAGAAFLERLGARRGLETHTNQLLVADLDRGLLRRWIERAPERAAGYELGFWEGPVPEEELEGVCRLVEVMNTAPRGELEIEDWKVTPEQLRSWEQGAQAAGDRVLTASARETATGRLVGFTQTAWNPNRPAVLSQWGTGVFPEHRGRGLGRWLKAAMLEHALAEYPGLTRVRTGNADENAAMLGINHALGFKPYLAHTDWQVETDAVLAYLASRQETP